MSVRTYGAALLGVLAIMAFAAPVSAARLNRHVRIHNNTSTTMERFFASNVGADDYEEDILGDDVISSGETWNINIDDGTGYCKYDLLAVFEDGARAKKNNVNVCAVSDFYFND
jgi:hypothetical protein